MNKVIRFTTAIIILVILAVLAFPSPVYAAAASGGAPISTRIAGEKVIFGGDYQLGDGDTLDEGLLVLGGNVTLGKGSVVKGDVVLMGGNMDIDGEVQGNAVVVGGTLHLLSNAIVDKDVSMTGGSLDRDPSATVKGQVTEGQHGPFEITVPGGTRIPMVDVNVSPLWAITRYLFTSFLVAFLAVLVVMFWPRQTERTAQTILAQPVIAFLIGVLTFVGAVILIAVMAITICLIPVAVLGAILLGAAIVFGWISMGMEIGRRLSRGFNQVWALPLAAGVGTLLLTLVADGFKAVPFWGTDCLGTLIASIVGAVGLGGVFLTRFGTREYLGTPIPPASGGAMAYPTSPLPPQYPPEPPDEPVDTGV